MGSVYVGQSVSDQSLSHTSVRTTPMLALACFAAAVIPLAARWIPDETLRIACGIVVTLAYFVFTRMARSSAVLHNTADLSTAFCVFALVQLLNDTIPGWVAANLLHESPTAGDPLAATVGGTVLVQLVEAAIAIVPITVLAYVSRGDFYLRMPASRRWMTIAVLAFVGIYVFVGTMPLRPGGVAQAFLPTNGVVSLNRFLALTPPLVVMVLSNGFEEEFLFRGLFVSKYNVLFGPILANILQALVFTSAHIGITYTPLSVLFLFVAVFPMGLIAGYLMRASNSLVVPAIIHAGLDIAIYIVFLSYAS